MESQASVKTKCDGCGATLSANSAYPDKRGTMSAHLNDGPNEQGYDQHNRYDYCGEACMLAHLTTRAKAKKTAKASATYYSAANVLELDITADARFISNKERNKKTEFFLDPANKAFPVENCTDVAAVMHRIGTYKGPLTPDEIKSRLKKRAAELGCNSSLPNADKPGADNKK